MGLALKIVGEACLNKKSETIETITEDIIGLSERMKEKMVQWNGIGLAAPQVGHNIRLIIIRLSTGKIQEMINPRISWTSDSRVKMEEGCLSIPEKNIWIDRPSKVRVKFQTQEGEFKYWCLSKMDARVFLHEYDHLEGILMTDRQ
jgi:peptide deformylase